MTTIDTVGIEAERNGAVRRITLRRPAKRNALTPEMFECIIAAFERPPPTTERLTLLQGEDPVFCAGVDLRQRARNDTRPGRTPLERLCSAIHDYPLPVVTVVQGAALGGGFMIAIHSDFVIAVDSAILGNTAVQYGLAPARQTASRLLARTGGSVAGDLLLLGDPVPARHLATVGAIQSAVAADQLGEEVDRVIDRLAANAPLSLRAIKATLAAPGYLKPNYDAIDDQVLRVSNSSDAREGARARREKRPPEFRGE